MVARTTDGLCCEFLDAMCDRFERDWKRGGRPRVEDHLRVWSDFWGELALELIYLDCYYRARGGATPTAAEYAGRFPDLPAAELAAAVSDATTHLAVRLARPTFVRPDLSPR
jgi:hypothetical protein